MHKETDKIDALKFIRLKFTRKFHQNNSKIGSVYKNQKTTARVAITTLSRQTKATIPANLPNNRGRERAGSNGFTALRQTTPKIANQTNKKSLKYKAGNEKPFHPFLSEMALPKHCF